MTAGSLFDRTELAIFTARFNPLSSGAMTAGYADGFALMRSLIDGFNPLSSGAMTAG